MNVQDVDQEFNVSLVVSAGVAFNPVDEYSVLNVNTHYLTLDELIPIFESIME